MRISCITCHEIKQTMPTKAETHKQCIKMKCTLLTDIQQQTVSKRISQCLIMISVDTYWPLRPRIASLASSLCRKTTKAKQGVLLVFQTSTRGPNFSNVFSKSFVLQLTGRSLTCTRTLSLSPLALRLLRLRRLGLRLRRRL